MDTNNQLTAYTNILRANQPTPTSVPGSDSLTPANYNNTLGIASQPTTTPQNPINASTLGGTTPINYATMQNYNPTDTSLLGTLGTADTAALAQPATPAEKTQQSLTDKIAQAYQKLTGKPLAQQQAEANAGLPDLNSQMNDLNSQINQLRSEDAAAQQRYVAAQAQVPASLNDYNSRINNRQFQIDSAFRSANMLALNSLQLGLMGKIANAKDMADRAVAAQFGPIEQELQYAQQMYTLNKDTLDREDKKRSEALQIQLQDRQRLLEQAKQDRMTIMGWATEAMKNNPNNQAVQLAAQQLMNPNMTDLSQAFGVIGQYLSDPNATQNAILDQQYKRAQINKLNTDINSQGIQNELTRAQIGKLNKETSLVGQPQPADIQAQQAASADKANNVQLVNDILGKSNSFAQIFGMGRFNPYSLLSGITGSSLQYTKNQIDQLKSVLSLENRQKLKGSGAISDFESRTLASASSALGTNISPEDAKKELAKIRGVFQTASGMTAPVKLTSKDGKTAYGTASKQQIEAAIRNGVTVEYQ